MDIKSRVSKLKNLMKSKNIDAVIIPSYDAHQSEYLADYWMSRRWISGFTGSAGTAVITDDECGLWTDGRYFIQAENELRDTGIKLFKMREKGVPTYEQWIVDTLDDNCTVAIDAKVFPLKVVNNLKEKFKDKNIKICDCDLVDEIWQDRPSLPMSKVYNHDVKYCGKSRSEKLTQLREELKKLGADYNVLSSLDDIAWLYNIRGNDIHNNPYVISFALISDEEAYLFVDDRKLDDEIKKVLTGDGIIIKGYEEIGEYIKNLPKDSSIFLDPIKTSYWLYNSIPESVKKIEDVNITTKLKAVKNETEIENLKNCQVKDGVAMVRFIKWLKENVGKEHMTEISVDEKLESFRAEGDAFVSNSFDAIVAYQANGAMMHYSATKDNHSEVKPEGFLLVDSGGQYYDGTTDITRTIVLGELTNDQIRDYTLTLRGHINLAKAKFLYGCTGDNIDILARRPLWEHGIDYKCGTGHGVGFFLGVHEGPQGISMRKSNVPIEAGMVTTNEPGVYKEGEYGIRIENTLLAKEDIENEYGKFMKFETISYCPIDIDAIDVKLMNENERKWLNDYHKMVYDVLSERLNEEEKAWLKNETRSI
ncbi:aminopeptidase P family protein [Clostridiaceae bacterium M8S5]|nr:aminopeptidase P family protein [Clostridiaceae bacterium M8S5]